ncbi:MAG: DUF547 domain-containing protein [Panacibacter sp.]
MKQFLLACISVIMYVNVFPSHETNLETGINIIEVSQHLLLAAKTGTPTDSLKNLLTTISSNYLTDQLTNDDEKKVFWINIYNAYTQIILSKNPDRYKNRSDFFSDKQIAIAGTLLSLDDIEHGILRRSKIKWSGGYLNKPFPAKLEKKLRVSKVDYRIHFTLNCGAKSCPPIAFYKPEQLDKQLDVATKASLSGETEYKPGENTVYLPALMGWFRADFGGKNKMIDLLKTKGIIPVDKNPNIKFKDYNWDLFLEHYKTE